MNLLTKALVVVVTILAVVMSALVIPFVAQVDDYRQSYEDMKDQRDATHAATELELAAARAQMSNVAGELALANAQITAHGDQIRQATLDNEALQAQLTQANSTLAQTMNANQVIVTATQTKDDQIDELNEVVRTQTAQVGDLNSSVQRLEQAIINVRAENQRLTDNFQRLQQRNVALEQQLSEADNTIQILEGRVADLGGSDDDPRGPVLPPPGVNDISGSVVTAQQLGDGQTLVQLNVGRSDQVEAGMLFVVSRGDEFIGNLLITTVDNNESVGRLTLGTGVQAGDSVRVGR